MMSARGCVCFLIAAAAVLAVAAPAMADATCAEAKDFVMSGGKCTVEGGIVNSTKICGMKAVSEGHRMCAKDDKDCHDCKAHFDIARSSECMKTIDDEEVKAQLESLDGICAVRQAKKDTMGCQGALYKITGSAECFGGGAPNVGNVCNMENECGKNLMSIMANCAAKKCNPKKDDKCDKLEEMATAAQADTRSAPSQLFYGACGMTDDDIVKPEEPKGDMTMPDCGVAKKSEKKCKKIPGCQFKKKKCVPEPVPKCEKAKKKNMCQKMDGCVYVKKKCIVKPVVECGIAKNKNMCKNIDGCTFKKKKCVEK